MLFLYANIVYDLHLQRSYEGKLYHVPDTMRNWNILSVSQGYPRRLITLKHTLASPLLPGTTLPTPMECARRPVECLDAVSLGKHGLPCQHSNILYNIYSAGAGTAVPEDHSVWIVFSHEEFLWTRINPHSASIPPPIMGVYIFHNHLFCVWILMIMPTISKELVIDIIKIKELW